MSHPRRVNEDDVEATEQAPDDRGFERKRLSRATGGKDLGCSLYVLAPGSKSWPYHYHTANEEAMYVLGGHGTVRIGGDTADLRPGDYVSFPTGEDGAHQVVNTGDEELRYLCFSTMVEPEVSIYPDSDMIGVFAGAPPGGDKEQRTLTKYLRGDAEVDYWDPED